MALNVKMMALFGVIITSRRDTRFPNERAIGRKCVPTVRESGSKTQLIRWEKLPCKYLSLALCFQTTKRQ